MSVSIAKPMSGPIWQRLFIIDRDGQLSLLQMHICIDGKFGVVSSDGVGVGGE